MMELVVEVLEAVRAKLLGPAEAWCGVLLEHNAMYGCAGKPTTCGSRPTQTDLAPMSSPPS